MGQMKKLIGAQVKLICTQVKLIVFAAVACPATQQVMGQPWVTSHLNWPIFQSYARQKRCKKGQCAGPIIYCFYA